MLNYQNIDYLIAENIMKIQDYFTVECFFQCLDFRAYYENKRASYNWYTCFPIEFNLKISKSQYKQLTDNFLIQKTWNNLLIENCHK